MRMARPPLTVRNPRESGDPVASRLQAPRSTPPRHVGEPRRTADCHLIHVPPSPFQGSASQAFADTHPRVSSSTGRAAVSKTAGCRFESYLARHLRHVRKTRFAEHQPTNKAIREFSE